MSDLGMTVVLSRDLLGLGDLDVNDHSNYYISSQSFLSAQMQWTRQQATSVWLDGAVTVTRQKQMVQEPVTFEVLGDDITDLQANVKALYDCLMQDSFTMGIAIGSAVWEYQCEAADFSVSWNGPRLIANQVQVTASIPRQPDPISGGY